MQGALCGNVNAPHKLLNESRLSRGNAWATYRKLLDESRLSHSAAVEFIHLTARHTQRVADESMRSWDRRTLGIYGAFSYVREPCRAPWPACSLIPILASPIQQQLLCQPLKWCIAASSTQNVINIFNDLVRMLAGGHNPHVFSRTHDG
eukprot:scaffold127886_cov21-Tisochrysis_lutea.AAC.2